MKLINKIITIKIFFFSSTVCLLLLSSYLNFSINKTINNVSKKIFIIEAGDSVSKTIKKLKDNNIIASEMRFKIMAYIYDINPKFISGKYRILNDETEQSLLVKFLNGNLFQESITIIEGSTHNDIIKLLSNNKHIKNLNEDISSNISFTSIIRFKSNEGRCFPDTYKFSSGILLQDILLNCSKRMENILLKHWKNRDYSLPYKSPYEMLIMASIIEKESSVLAEKPFIASVFVNRLRKKMRLQADPTVIYGIKDYKGNITKKDLKANNEYNTYKIYGLPKTPICSPSESSIRAASKPAESNFLFFVANNKGKHIFSINYSDHVKAVNKYQK